MSILIIYCELSRSSVKSYKSRIEIIAKEIKKGRRTDQVSLNGALFIVHTPEQAMAFLSRIVRSCNMDEKIDRVSVMDIKNRKIFIHGNFDDEIKIKFPFIVESIII